jgi:hypothetical protein
MVALLQNFPYLRLEQPRDLSMQTIDGFELGHHLAATRCFVVSAQILFFLTLCSRSVFLAFVAFREEELQKVVVLCPGVFAVEPMSDDWSVADSGTAEGAGRTSFWAGS